MPAQPSSCKTSPRNQADDLGAAPGKTSPDASDSRTAAIKDGRVTLCVGPPYAVGTHMKLIGVAIILALSITTAFAGTAPIRKKVAQDTSCFTNCAVAFNLCLQVCGSGCTAFSGVKPAVSRNCDNEQSLCQLRCAAAPSRPVPIVR